MTGRSDCQAGDRLRRLAEGLRIGLDRARLACRHALRSPLRIPSDRPEFERLILFRRVPVAMKRPVQLRETVRDGQDEAMRSPRCED